MENKATITATTEPELVRDDENVVVEEKKLQEINDRIKQMEDRAGRFEEDLKMKQSEIIGIMAVFIALFTFISINVTIFTQTKDLMTACVFMFLMTLCTIIILSLCIMLLVGKPASKATTASLVVSLLLLIAVTAVCYFTGNRFPLSI